MTHDSSRLAIAVLNYRMPELVQSMGQQLAGGPYDCYLFNNGGGGVLRADWATVVSWPENCLFSAGWNRAMVLLHDYDYVWMLNDDLEGLSQELAGQLLEMFGPGAAVVTPAFNSPHAVFHRRYLGRPFPAGNKRRVNWIDWTCPLVCMDAWRDVGQFDAQFVGYGADLDWCKRARLKGWEFYVADVGNIHHIGSATALKHGLQDRQGNVAEMNRLLKKNWGVANWAQMT